MTPDGIRRCLRRIECIDWAMMLKFLRLGKDATQLGGALDVAESAFHR